MLYVVVDTSLEDMDVMEEVVWEVWEMKAVSYNVAKTQICIILIGNVAGNY
jgi:hypothetical protein